MLNISHNTTITGNIRSPGPIQISGNVKGNGTFDDLLVISPTCIWEGDIVADSIIVEGKITGNIIGRKNIQIASRAQIVGDISTPKLTIAPGAIIKSYVNMRPMPKPIELIFNTPSHHRVHHASNIRYLDCNHAGVLIIWDRMFGTFSEEKDLEKPVYGLTKNIESHHPVTVATHEYGAIWKDVKRAKKWSDKLKYIFLAPGWSHDGPDKRAKVLRKALKEKAV